MIGFTGTRWGMTPQQKNSVDRLLVGVKSVVHGGCIGADSDFHKLARLHSCYTIVYPSNIQHTHGDYQNADEIMPELPPLERDRIIVNLCTTLIATPKGYKEELRSGTWTTVRYARRKDIMFGIDIIIVTPDGMLHYGGSI